MNERVVCYVTDLNFLLPTLAAAISLRKFIKCGTDVIIFLVEEEYLVAEIRTAIAEYNIQVFYLDQKSFSDFDTRTFKKSHVPIAALGRFCLHEVLPKCHKTLIYMDGDTLV